MREPELTAKAIFDRAHEIAAPEQRRAYLDEACGDNAELRQQVEALLAAYDEAGSFLDKPAAVTAETSDAAPGQWLDPNNLPGTQLEGVGSRIGPYKLLQQIGEGGMGVVFMAEQQEPVRRLVALKVVKAGMDTAQVIARFEAERQALAMMDHPNIAKVLDGGTTASGRPFFVMELVKGIPITRYCDEQRLSLRQRMELFVPVCQAIQHAHQKGIIHRDIKPSNVLIAAYDGQSVPKVIDFGVAKATGAKLTERTLFTAFGALIGTLEYMSPEQAEFNALDIDTRSDVYSLGVLLYELLTGSTPLTRQQLKDTPITEVLRLIREEEPPRPSTRLSETKETLASVSSQRSMEPAGLLKAVRGEVDWIVMKALDKDRTRRYETANGLARDIQRYLAEEPVEAGPPSATYRLRKLAWKHRGGLATAATIVLLLVAGVVASTSFAVWAMGAEKQTMSERNHALKAEADAKAVLEFFRDNVLSAGRPKGQHGGLGSDVKLIDALNQAQEKIGDSFKDRPEVEASIRDTLGSTYWLLRDYPQAIRQLERAVALFEATVGPDHPDTTTVRRNLALSYVYSERLAEGNHLQEQNRKLMAAMPENVRRLQELADRFYEARSQLGEDANKTLEAWSKYAWQLGAFGKWEEAAEEYRRLLAAGLRAFRAGNQRAEQWAFDYLQFVANSLCSNPEATAGARAILCPPPPLSRQKMRLPPWWMYQGRCELGAALLAKKKYSEAEPLLLSGYLGLKESLEQVPPNFRHHVTKVVKGLVEVYEATGQKDEAERWRKELAVSQTADKK